MALSTTTEISTTSFAERVAAAVRAEMAAQQKPLSEFAGALGVTTKTARTRYSGAKSLTVGELAAISHWLGQPVERFTDV